MICSRPSTWSAVTRSAVVAQLILEKNLFGLDIDGRAAQLTGFALMMKGRADDRRFFERGVKLNVMALVDSTGFDAERLAQRVKLVDYGLVDSDLTELKQLFEHASTFGSLIQVPEGLSAELPALKQLSEATSQDLFVSDALKRLGLLVRQAELLAGQYDAVVANPPYMGSKGMNALVKKFAKDHFPDAKSDLFACFIERATHWRGMPATRHGHHAELDVPVVVQKNAREYAAGENHQDDGSPGSAGFRKHLGRGGSNNSVCVAKPITAGLQAVFFRLLDGGEAEKQAALANGEKRFDTTAQDEFKKIPGSPVAYWVSDCFRRLFEQGETLHESGVHPATGLQTGDNPRFIRCWWEIDTETRSQKWIPLNDGGSLRKWYGNLFLI